MVQSMNARASDRWKTVTPAQGAMAEGMQRLPQMARITQMEYKGSSGMECKYIRSGLAYRQAEYQ